MFDTHCHLQDVRLCGDVDAVVARALSGGVDRMVCCAVRPSDWELVAELALRFDVIIPAFGIHPWYADEAESGWELELRRRLQQFSEACVGEIGLDYARRNRDDVRQQELFSGQLQIAAEMDRVVSVHCVRAWGALLKTLPQFRGLALVLHAYGGSPELTRQLLAYNVWFSFAGTVTKTGSSRIRQRVCSVPLERILLESDAPDMLPYQLAGGTQNNEPCHLHFVAEAVAECLGMGVTELCSQADANAQGLFLR